MSDLRWGGVTQALNWITSVFPEDIFTKFLFDRGRECVVSVEGFYVKAPLAMFSTKTRQGSAKILVRVRWFNNVCICRWTMMIRITVSSQSGPFSGTQTCGTQGRIFFPTAVEAEWKSSLIRRGGII